MTVNSLRDAMLEELRDMLSAEKQLTKALPKLAKKSSHAELKHAFESHLKETERHVERLEQAFEALGKSARAQRCHAMEGIIEEGKEVMDKDVEPDVLDAMLIGSAQKAEHYEIATYGTLCTWAELLGEEKVLKLLRQNMDEEESADKKLTQIAKSTVNREAMHASA